MATITAPVRPELLEASDEQIEDAVAHGDAMVLRGLIYQLTGDKELSDVPVKKVPAGLFEARAPARDEDAALIRRKAVEYLKAYRDSGAGEVDYGPPERLPESFGLIMGGTVDPVSLPMFIEEIGLDPWSRSLQWKQQPEPEQLENFSVTIIGTGMGGLNAALQLKRAGIPHTVVEKNSGVGGTWYENRYPGARVDTPSRMYTHVFGVDYSYSSAFCGHEENRKYFEWVAENFDLYKDIAFNTEVRSLTWDEDASMWDVEIEGPEGKRTIRSNAVISSVGFLNRPNVPAIEGMESFEGPMFHTARWPEELDLEGKRIAVIGTGCTGYQMVPELAKIDGTEVTVFQRTPQWLMPIPGYLKKFPPQVAWLDRNLPYHTNFMRFRAAYRPDSEVLDMFTIVPGFDDPDACGPTNKALRDRSIEFLEKKLDDPELVKTMTPDFPVWSSRPVLVDEDECILDALQWDNVHLVTSGVDRITQGGIVSGDGTEHEFDIIVLATGFKPNNYLFPMEITGRDGVKLEEFWAEGGPRAYIGCMIPHFPNLWSIYGPNTNGGLPVAANHEMTSLYAMQCMERLITEGKKSVEVREDAYWRFNELVDRRNSGLVWSDPRAHNYYWTQHGRSVVMNPFGASEMWRFLQKPDFDDLEIA